MPTPSVYPVIGLLDGVTGTGNGPSLPLQGKALMFAGRKTEFVPIEIDMTLSDTAAGPTATVVIETSNDGSSWTTWQTLSFNAGSAKTQHLAPVGKLTKIYIRARVTAIAGTAPSLTGTVRMR